MIGPGEECPVLLDELERLLDSELELLELRRRQIEELMQAVIDRDDATLEPLLTAMGAAQRDQEQVDVKLSAVRAALAEALGVPAKQVKLATLIERAAASRRAALRMRRYEIILRMEGLRRRQLDAMILLNECARINQLLLRRLMPRTQNLTTYGARGTMLSAGGSGLVDAER